MWDILAKEAKAINKIGSKIGINAFQAGKLLLCTSLISKSLSSIISTFAANFLANQVETNKLGIETTKPTKITSPTESVRFKFPAAERGPGVGGTSVCVAKSPPERAIAIVPSGRFTFFATILLSFAKIIKPESQKTGIPTIAPITDIAKAGYFSPKSFRIISATLIAAPDLSKIAPMTQPKITIKPIFDINSPKPFPIVSANLSIGKPAKIPTPKAAKSKPAKGWSLNQVEEITIKAIAKKTTRIIMELIKK